RQDPAGAWAWEPLPERVYAELGYMGAGDFWWEPAEGGEGVLWILGQQNILRWELDGLRAAEARPADVIFRSLRRGSRRLAVASSAPPELPFAREPLRASFASPHFAPGA